MIQQYTILILSYIFPHHMKRVCYMYMIFLYRFDVKENGKRIADILIEIRNAYTIYH
ncbi:hypothetical protein ACS4JF_28660 [Bacillus thuringiensis]|uniref:hypothetical protein n=1 Tax=Bacillus thuringiensis TaxID=1428 RepID=UPI0018CC95DB|nr:hypothetical protein [Bacillus thuringiensis]